MSETTTDGRVLRPGEQQGHSEYPEEWENDDGTWSYLMNILDDHTCQRCENAHQGEQVEIKEFRNPVVDDAATWRWWYTCPESGDPVLMCNPDEWSEPEVET